MSLSKSAILVYKPVIYIPYSKEKVKTFALQKDKNGKTGVKQWSGDAHPWFWSFPGN
jgi:hypothetical protein